MTECTQAIVKVVLLPLGVSGLGESMSRRGRVGVVTRPRRTVVMVIRIVVGAGVA